ncbi:putative protein FAM172B [Suricata suricatta]|uniref:putative protein FAM172B n=1 Tax=Suricata suricatta TaxID=37032 RepID=UPI001155F548|nr:putative protein FAM172B [Suricata suricatta]
MEVERRDGNIKKESWLSVIQELSFQKFIGQSNLLEELNYDFNEKAELRHTETQRPFVFNYYKNVFERNSKRYQALSYLLEQYIYELLEKVCKLQKVYIPTEADKEPRSFFFMSERALTSHHSVLLVLLQDHGVFRAGQWSQQAIIHHGLQHGSQIPCIQMALQAHYEVIVLNPNDNFIDLNIEKEWKGLKTQNKGSSSLKMVSAENFLGMQPLQCIPKRCSNTPEEHMAYIWDYFISKTEGKDVAFIVHGYGGLVFMDLLVHRKWEVMNKVYAVALIDSEHHVGHQLGSDVQLLAWIKHHCREWVTSPKPLDKPAATVLKQEFPMVSAANIRVSTTYSSIVGIEDTHKQGQHCLYPSGVHNEQQIVSVKSVQKYKKACPWWRDVIGKRREERAGFPAADHPKGTETKRTNRLSCV